MMARMAQDERDMRLAPPAVPHNRRSRAYARNGHIRTLLTHWFDADSLGALTRLQTQLKHAANSNAQPPADYLEQLLRLAARVSLETEWFTDAVLVPATRQTAQGKLGLARVLRRRVWLFNRLLMLAKMQVQGQQARKQDWAALAQQLARYADMDATACAQALTAHSTSGAASETSRVCADLMPLHYHTQTLVTVVHAARRVAKRSRGASGVGAVYGSSLWRQRVRSALRRHTLAAQHDMVAAINEATVAVRGDALLAAVNEMRGPAAPVDVDVAMGSDAVPNDTPTLTRESYWTRSMYLPVVAPRAAVTPAATPTAAAPASRADWLRSRGLPTMATPVRRRASPFRPHTSPPRPVSVAVEDEGDDEIISDVLAKVAEADSPEALDRSYYSRFNDIYADAP
jgi:hypothetical protein